MLKGNSSQESHIGSHAHLEMHLDTGMINNTILCVLQGEWYYNKESPCQYSIKNVHNHIRLFTMQYLLIDSIKIILHGSSPQIDQKGIPTINDEQ